MGRVIEFPLAPQHSVASAVPTPPAREPVSRFTCPVCGVDSASNLDAWTCHGCGVLMHEACHWGRVASLDEWRVFIRRFETDEPWGQVPEDIAVLCPACRERGGVA